MAGDIQPLDNKFQIVDAQGRPTEYFTRWAQQKQIDIGNGITLAQAQALVDAFAAGRQIIAGRALDGGGFLSADVTIDHAESLVVPGTYGDATHVPQFVVDQEGHIQGVVLVAISGGGGGGLTALSVPNINTLATPSVNFYIGRMIIVDADFTINKIAFEASTATATAKFQPFVYTCSSAGVPGALLGSGLQVTGTLAGYNEAPLTAPVAVLKGQLIFVGVNVITAAIANLWHAAAGRAGNAANGGSSVPSNPAPAMTVVTGAGGIYGFWPVT